MELKRKLWLVLAVVAMLVLSVVTALADELVTNGTLDTSDGWTYGSLAQWTDAYDHTGNSGGSAIMEAYNDPDSCIWQSLPTDAGGGTTTISGWARSESGTGIASIRIVVNGVYGALEIIDYDITTDWELLTDEIVTESEPVPDSVEIYVCNSAYPGPDIIFDDISVDFQPSPPTPTPTPIPPTFNEMTNYSIVVFGLVAVALVFSEQVGRLVYVWIWRIRRE